MELSSKGSCRVLAFVGAACLLGAGLLFALACTPAHAATPVNKTIVKYNAGAVASGTVKTKTVTKYDVTGDKKKDTITFKTSYSEYKTKVAVYLKGKKVKTFSPDYGFDGSAPVSIKYLRTAGKQPFLYVTITVDDEDGLYGIYRYQKGTFKKLISPTSEMAQKYGIHMHIASAKAVGKLVKVRYDSMTFATGWTRYNYSYKYQARKLVRTGSMAGSLTLTQKKGLHFTTKTALYASPKAKTRLGKVYAGTSANVLSLRVVGHTPWLKVKTRTGKTGWVKGIDGPQSTKIAKSSGRVYYTLFKELQMAG